jgi:(2Fe-2S) ferredoxin
MPRRSRGGQSLPKARYPSTTTASGSRGRYRYNPCMPPYERHVFVCVNERPAGHPRGCCSDKNSVEIRDRLKRMANRAGLKGRVRVNAAGCLDVCERGVTVVVYPEAVWYGGVTLDDVEEIFQSHILDGQPVERLRLERVSDAD